MNEKLQVGGFPGLVSRETNAALRTYSAEKGYLDLVRKQHFPLNMARKDCCILEADLFDTTLCSNARLQTLG